MLLVILSSIALSIFAWNIPSILNHDGVLEEQSKSEVTPSSELPATNLNLLKGASEDKHAESEVNHKPESSKDIEQESPKASIKKTENK